MWRPRFDTATKSHSTAYRSREIRRPGGWRLVETAEPGLAGGGNMVGYGAGTRLEATHLPPVVTVNAGGASPFVLACDHASNRIPEKYGDLGLSPRQRLMHIAWDPGALPVALRLSERLDAPLVFSNVSRLVIDCNR